MRCHALFGCALLVLHPRIFANAFYDSKDMGFAALFIIAVWTLERYRSRPSAGRILFHAAMTAAAICARLPGILLPSITVFVGLIDLSRAPDKVRRTGHLVLYLAAAAVMTTLLWPTLWQGPFDQFMAAFRKMAHNLNAPEGVLFNGVFHMMDAQPRTYLPVWIMISTPPVFLTLLWIGTATAFHRLMTALPDLKPLRSRHLTYALWLWSPMLFYVSGDSYIYDGWRHYYFLYPALALWMVRGWEWMWAVIADRRWSVWVIGVVCALTLVVLLLTMRRFR